MRAVVVGAGLAGLAAADELARNGAEVVVLEARSRVGGRVWSQTLPNGAVVEMGAEYILPGNTAILELVDRFGLGLWDKGMRYGRRDPKGGIGTTHDELVAAMEVAERELASGAHAGASAEQFLDSIDIPAGAREAILARVEISCANTGDRVAAVELGGVAHIDDEPSPGIAGGNQRLPLALAGELGDALRLESPVRAIAWDERSLMGRGPSERGVRAVTDRGEVEAFQHRRFLAAHISAGAHAHVQLEIVGRALDGAAEPVGLVR
jgi:glycine/D-amino acid oxidase-like deaminating enzyme